MDAMQGFLFLLIILAIMVPFAFHHISKLSHSEVIDYYMTQFRSVIDNELMNSTVRR